MGDTRRQARRIRSLAGGDGEPDQLGRPAAGGRRRRRRRNCRCRRRPAPRRSCFRPTGDERERRGRCGSAPGIATANSTTGMRRHIGRSSRSRWSCSARASVSKTSSLRPAPSCFSQARFRKCPFQSPRKTRSVLNRPQSRKPARHVGRVASRTFALSRVFQQASTGAQGDVAAMADDLRANLGEFFPKSCH